MRKDLLGVLGNFIKIGLTQGSKNGEGDIIERYIKIASDNYKYQVYLPPRAAERKDLPIIIFLHGIRERGSEGFVPIEGAAGNLVRHYFRQIPAIVLLPQCRQETYWSEPLMDQMTMLALEQSLKEFSADPKRVYLIGVSMGGYGVWHFASEHRSKFAAAVSICGGSPILTGDRFLPIAKKIGSLPAWIFHGSEDRIVPVSESRELVRTLRAIGSDVKYTEYEGVGHNAWLNVLGEKDLLPWLLKQRNSLK